MKCSPGVNFCASIPAFLFSIDEILREIAAENIRRMKRLNGRFFAESPVELLQTDMEMCDSA